MGLGTSLEDFEVLEKESVLALATESVQSLVSELDWLLAMV